MKGSKRALSLTGRIRIRPSPSGSGALLRRPKSDPTFGPSHALVDRGVPPPVSTRGVGAQLARASRPNDCRGDAQEPERYRPRPGPLPPSPLAIPIAELGWVAPARIPARRQPAGETERSTRVSRHGRTPGRSR